MSKHKKLGLCTLVLAAVLIMMSLSVFAAPITSTQADGIIAYAQLDTASPRYRLWNSSNNFTLEQSDALYIGTNGTQDIVWTVVKGNHERDEVIMGTQDQSGDINIQILNITKQWGNLQEVTTDVTNANYRGFDIAIEDVSGDVLIVYENSSAASNNVLAYRIWNGTGYGTEQRLDTLLVNSPIVWVQLTSRRGADDIMALVHNNAGDLYAALWNGTGFDMVRNLTVSTGTASNTQEHFAFAWEANSDDGLVVYGEGNDFVYRTFSLTAPFWSGTATIALANSMQGVRLCSDPTSDYVGIIEQDGGNDVNARMWDGSQILTGEPAEDAQTEGQGSSAANVDCAWYNASTAVFAFVDTNNPALDYFTFTKSNSWNTTDLTSASITSNFASDDIASLRFVKHPITSELMAVTLDIAEDLSLARWNAVGFVGVGESPVEASMEVLNGDQEGAQFEWYKFDPVPNVTNITPAGLNYPLNTLVNLSVNVTDNVNVSTVLAQVTFPNGSMLQFTLGNMSASRYNITFNATNLNGVYTLVIIANDSSVHANVNSTQNVTFTIGDAIVPNVTNITPIQYAHFQLNGLVNVTVNATDNINVSTVLANITLPNGTTYLLTLVRETVVFDPSTESGRSNTFNATFNITDLIGTYTLQIRANDTSNQVNQSETTLFTVGDVYAPNVTNITPSGTNYDANAAVNITANISEDTALDAVFANITFPNGTITQLSLSNRSQYTFNGTFSATRSVGTYTVRIIANDSVNNVNSSETTTFTVGDPTPPNVTLTAPLNHSNFSSSSIDFTFNATDNVDLTFNCSLTLNGTQNVTNTSVVNAVLTSFSVAGLSEGHHSYNISCTDQSNNTNTSMMHLFTVDTKPPQFNSLTTSPSSSLGLDPGVNVTVLANITDNSTTVQSVVLQYKLNNESDDSYVNVSMAYVAQSGLFNISFNATRNGTYNLRVFANDSARNADLSSVVNISVEIDRVWTRSPSSFAAVSTSLNTNVTLGNLTINNTGDVDLYFNITSNSAQTRFNETQNFTLAAGSVKQLTVADNGTAAGVKSITLTISVNDTRADSTSLVTTGTVVVAEGQPILAVSFTSPTTDTLAATLGDTNVEFRAKVENIGTTNATNVSLFFTLPAEWIITFGSITSEFSELATNESQEATVRVTIPSNFTAGTTGVYANTTGINSSGGNLTTSNLVFGDQILVTVGQQGSLGGGGSSSGGGGSSSSSPAAAAASGGGGGGKVSVQPRGKISQTIESTESISVLRASSTSAPVVITNLYKNAVMEHIDVEVEGFLNDYAMLSPIADYGDALSLDLSEQESARFESDGVKHSLTLDERLGDTVRVTVRSEPQELMLQRDTLRYVDIDGDGRGDVCVRFNGGNNDASVTLFLLPQLKNARLDYGERLHYSLDVYAPAYLVRSDYNLTLRIVADIVPLDPQAAGFERKQITELRTLLFKVHEISDAEIVGEIDTARTDVHALSAAGFFTQTVAKLLHDAEIALEQGDYELAHELVAQIHNERVHAFVAADLITDVRRLVAEAAEQWLSVPHTEQALELAVLAFERGEFETARERAKTAQLQYLLETKGRINILWFVRAYWMYIILFGVASLVVLYVAYNRFVVIVINQRLRNLVKEQDTIHVLLKDVQHQYIVERTLSQSQYQRYRTHYDKRLAEIEELRVELRNKRAVILSSQKELALLGHEKKELQQLMQQSQVDYFIRKNITRHHFVGSHDRYSVRLQEIEQHEAKVLLRVRSLKSLKIRAAALMKAATDELQWGISTFANYVKKLFGRDSVRPSFFVPRSKTPVIQRGPLGQILSSVALSAQKISQLSHASRGTTPLPSHHAPSHAPSHAVRSPVLHAYQQSRRLPVVQPQLLQRAPLTRPVKHAQDWVMVKVPDSVLLEVYCDKNEVELPKKSAAYERTFDEVEAFNHELLRMARSVQREQRSEAKEPSLLEVQDYAKQAEEKRQRRDFND